jgi:hypothetical protein
VPAGATKDKRDRGSQRRGDRHANGARVEGSQDEDDEEDEQTGDDEEKRRAEDEQRWRARIADARDQIKRSRMFAEALQSRINALNADFSARDDPAQRSAIGAQLNEALAELERVRGEIEAQEQGVSDLEEEARRAGVPPGWLR